MINFLAIYVPKMLVKSEEINYIDVGEIYKNNENGLRIKFNQKYNDGNTNSIASEIYMNQEDIKFGDAMSTWTKSSTETYKEFLDSIADDLNDNHQDMAAYWIDANQGSSNEWNINAVVYVNATSPASAPVFGNLLL